MIGGVKAARRRKIVTKYVTLRCVNVVWFSGGYADFDGVRESVKVTVECLCFRQKCYGVDRFCQRRALTTGKIVRAGDRDACASRFSTTTDYAGARLGSLSQFQPDSVLISGHGLL